MSIDLAAAEELFEASTDVTVGIEEEFAHPRPRDARPRPALRGAARRRRADDPVLAEAIAGELISSEIEIRSGRGEDVARRAAPPARRAPPAVRARRRARRRARARPARTRGPTTASSTSSTPSTTAASTTACSTSRGATTRSRCTSTSASRGADRAVRVCDRLRPVLPLLLGISANSPYLDGRDSGLHSARTQTFTKTLPALRHPRRLRLLGRPSRDYVEFLVRTDSIVEFTQVWWSVRPHLSFGTVEVRICDAQTHRAPRPRRSAALIVACVAAGRCATSTRACRFADPPRPADRGELVARDPLRAGRQAARPRRAARSSRRPRRSSGCWQWTAPVRAELGDRAGFPGSTAPSASAARSTPVPACRRSTPPRCARPVRPTSRRPRPHERAAAATQPGSPPRRSCAPRYEAELKQIRVEDVLLQTVVSLINLGACAPGWCRATRARRDPSSCAQAIEAVRALLPLVEPRARRPTLGQIRDALSRLQMAYARLASAGARRARRRPRSRREPAPQSAPQPPSPDEPGPAQSSGRLWVPGQ